MSASRNRSAGLHEATLRKLRVKREPRGPYMVSADDFDYETGEALWDKSSNFRGRGRGRGHGGRWGGGRGGGRGSHGGRGRDGKMRGDRRDFEDDKERTDPYARPRRRQRYRQRRERRYDAPKPKDDGSYSLFDDDDPNDSGHLPFARGSNKAAQPVTSADPTEADKIGNTSFGDKPLMNMDTEEDGLGQRTRRGKKKKRRKDEDKGELIEDSIPEFMASDEWAGPREHYYFCKGQHGLGYYLDPRNPPPPPEEKPPEIEEEPEPTEAPAEPEEKEYKEPPQITKDRINPIMDLDDFDIDGLTQMYTDVHAIVAELPKTERKRKHAKLLMKRIKLELEERYLDNPEEAPQESEV